MPILMWRRHAPFLCLVLATLALLVALWEAKRVVADKDAFYANLATVHVTPPLGTPAMDRQSLYQAVVIFNIRIPKDVDFPEFDPELPDRGLTSLDAWTKKYKVKIGPSAFQSWGILGSTLAHEFEVHCQQNFGLIQLQDLMGMDGTGQAERQAYNYEIANAERFGLSEDETRLIRETMDYFYPQEPGGGPRLATVLRQSLGSWIDTRLLANARAFDRIP